LRPLSFVRAKGAVPVAGVPIATRILRTLAAAGVEDAVLNLHHLPETLTRRIGDGSSLGVRVRYSWEVPLLGSAGGPRRAVPLLASPTILIVNGDTLTDVDITGLLAEHARTKALVTLAVVPNTEPQKYGGLAVDEEGRVTGLVRRGAEQASAHFIGVQVAEAAAFDSVPLDTPYESVARLYLDLLARHPGSIRTWQCDAEFLDIGTSADYLESSLVIAEREGIARDVGINCDVAPTARVQRSILWDDVTVEDGALLRETIVTDGVRVPADTSWHGVVLRVARGELAPDEKRIGHLAVSNLSLRSRQ
jgi:NDP-sugar pyrophosphorylase family protein